MLYPMFALVLITFTVLLLTLRVRISSVRKGSIDLNYFQLMQGGEVPDIVTKTTRQISNLFEVPVLFYVAGLLYISLELSTTFPVSCAWGFVIARVMHTAIHLSYNNVLHRVAVFGLGNLCVLAMWISIIMAAGD